jgi:hypothetical protein
LVLSKTRDAVTAVADVVPVLHTRAPTGKSVGPVDGLLLSSPSTFHVTGVIVKTGEAAAGEAVTASAVELASTARAATSPRRRAGRTGGAGGRTVMRELSEEGGERLFNPRRRLDHLE